MVYKGVFCASEMAFFLQLPSPAFTRLVEDTFFDFSLTTDLHIPLNESRRQRGNDHFSAQFTTLTTLTTSPEDGKSGKTTMSKILEKKNTDC